MHDVITIGSATVDVFAHTESELIKIKTLYSEEELIAYPSGSKILITKLDFKVGGGGINTSVCLSHLGLKIAFLGNLGKDENGSKVVDLLKKEKIDFIGVRSRSQTGFSIILDSIEDDRTILTNKGANNELRFSDIKLPQIRAGWFYFSSMMGTSLKTLEKLAAYAKKKKINIAFNPSSYLIRANPKSVKNILKNTDLLVFNREEAELLHGSNDKKAMLRLCHSLGPRIVVITDGSNGCTASDGKHFYSIKPKKIKVVETTGAGDAFASSFLAGFIKKNDVKFSLRLGMANAESVVQHIGASEKLLKYNAALASIKKNPHKIHVEKIR